MLLTLNATTVDLDDGTVQRGDARDQLSPLELRLLRYLARRPGLVATNDELLRDVWGYAPGIVTRTITATAHRLRAKIESDAGAPDHVRTVWGIGLRFDVANAWDPALMSIVRRLEGVGARDLAASVRAALSIAEPTTYRAVRRI